MQSRTFGDLILPKNILKTCMLARRKFVFFQRDLCPSFHNFSIASVVATLASQITKTKSYCRVKINK